MSLIDERVVTQPLVMKWIDERGQESSAFFYVDTRLNGQEVEGVPVLEVDLGADPKDERYQNPPPEKENNTLIFQKTVIIHLVMGETADTIGYEKHLWISFHPAVEGDFFNGVTSDV